MGVGYNKHITDQTLCPARCICGTVHPYENMVDYMYRMEDEEGVDIFSLSNYTSVFYANLAKTNKQQQSLSYGLQKRLRFTVAKKGKKF